MHEVQKINEAEVPANIYLRET